MVIDREELITRVTREVVARLSKELSSAATPSLSGGMFLTVDEAVAAAVAAQRRVAAMSLADRGRMCDIVKRVCSENASELARIELPETKLGRLDHKVVKLQNIRYVLGPEAMTSQAMSDASGLCVIEHAPWGVIGMVLPATHCVPTLAMNCTLFIQNAPSYASLGIGGPSYLSHSIATPTGEGVTTPLTFTRERRIVVGGGALRVV